MTTQELYNYRVGLIRDAVKMERKPERTPHLANFWTWKIFDSGYKLRQAFYDFGIMEKAVMNFQQQYQFDYLIDFGTRNSVALAETLGSSVYEIDDENDLMNTRDNPPMKFEEYDDLVADYRKFLWEKMMPARYPRFAKGLSVAEFQKTIMAFLAYGQYTLKITGRLREECGIAPAPGTAIGGHDMLFNFFRGIKGLSYDMRKDPGKVRAAIEALNRQMLDPALAAMEASPGPDPNLAFDLFYASLSHTIVNRKQWEDYIWPDFKKIVETAARTNKTVYIFTEGITGRFWDYLKELPAGHAAMHVEQDDIFEARKALPNLCLVGGMPASLLGGGTPKECVDYAKRLIDEVGADGGFILSQDKMISYRNDCRSENLKAVCDFVREYRTL